MKRRVLIRADGGRQIGMGHLVRCSALGQMLQTNYNVCFFILNPEGNVSKVIADAGLSIKEIESEEGFFNGLVESDIVVLDGYYFEASYEARIKAHGCLLICVDDLHDRHFTADLVINHAPGAAPQDYSVEPHTALALGLDYSLLRPKFLHAARETRVIDSVRSACICFGGADPENLTYTALNEIVSFSALTAITVITGHAYGGMGQLQPFLNVDPRIRLLSNLNEEEMMRELSKSDVAVVPASGILLEALACGTVPVSGFYRDNQKDLYTQFKLLNAFVDAGTFTGREIRIAMEKCLTGGIARPQQVIDGLSGERILKLVGQLVVADEIVLRDAAAVDADLTFGWAANPVIRAFSFQQKKIEKEEHDVWFSNKLSDPNCFYYIGEHAGVSIGSIRFDVNASGEAIISYLIDPAQHNMGFGLSLLLKGLMRLKVEKPEHHIDKVVGYVKAENIASVRVFEKLGFLKLNEPDSLKFEKTF
jgi:UDP-2,4-diacetamido-2,4,6-trideoxy-beta-L-altropyranose hydrolase